MKDLASNLCALLKIKSIISLASAGVFCYLAIVGKISPENAMTIIVMVFTYFFTKDIK